MLKDLPSEVIQNVSSYLIGKAEDVRLKRNEALKNIQKKYQTKYSDIGTDVDYYNGILEEFFAYSIKPKIKNLKFSLSLIDKQSEKIRKMLKQSYLLYQQPDMKTEISIRMEGFVLPKHSYYETEVELLETGAFDISCFNGVYNIDDVLLELSNKWFDRVDTLCGERYDDVVIGDMYFTINIVVFTDE